MSESVAFLIADASRLFRRAFDARARDLGVTGQQWRVLVTLFRNPGINQGAAAELLEVEPITLSRMVDRLQDARLVERRPDPGDRRAWLLHLTDAAVPLIDQIRDIANEILESALDGMSADERTRFSDLADRFRANLSRPAPLRQDDDDDRPAEPRHVRTA